MGELTAAVLRALKEALELEGKELVVHDPSPVP